MSGGGAFSREAGSLDEIRAGSGESVPLPAKRTRPPRAGDFWPLARAVEARLPPGDGWEERVSDTGVFVGRYRARGHWLGQHVRDAGEIPVALDAVWRRIGECKDSRPAGRAGR